jgi:hypothetical protein
MPAKRIWAVIGFVVLTTVFSLARDKRSAVSALPVMAQSRISAIVGRNDLRYQARMDDGQVQLENPANDMTAAFAAEGVSVSARGLRWRLTFQRWGHGNNLRVLSPVRPRTLLNRVEYRRDDLTEWYENGPLGLEQGFAVNRRPTDFADGPLLLEFGVSGASLDSGKDETSLNVLDHHTHARLHYADLSAVDADGQQLPARFILRAHTILIEVNDIGARYPVSIDPLIRQAQLIPSDGQQYSFFGNSVAVSGNTVVVGAPGYNDDNGNSVPGYAYVFVKPEGGWVNMLQTAELKASDGGNAAGNNFGSAVAIAGNTIVVGCQGLSEAYVYIKPPSGWTNMTETAILSAGSSAATFGFGYSVAIDTPADTVLVGSVYAAFNGGGPQGAAYVFVKPQSGWQNTSVANALLTASNGKVNDLFGVSVAIASDTIAVGASGKPYPENFGTIYAYAKPAAGWSNMTETAELFSSNNQRNAALGTSVAVLGNTIVSGAPGGASPQPAGNVYVFVAPPTGWRNATQTAELTDGSGVYDSLGWSVALVNEAVVAGAPGSSIGSNQQEGAVYVFRKPASGWKSTSKYNAQLTAMYGEVGDSLGTSVAAGDELAVGGAPDAYGGGDVGLAYVFFIGK